MRGGTVSIMRRVFASLVLLAACGGPTQQQLAETPAATTKPKPPNAPPASPADTDRAQMTQSFEDMTVTQEAYREAGAEVTVPPNKPAPVKKGPAVQAPPAPTKEAQR